MLVLAKVELSTEPPVHSSVDFATFEEPVLVTARSLVAEARLCPDLAGPGNAVVPEVKGLPRRRKYGGSFVHTDHPLGELILANPDECLGHGSR